MTILFAFLVSIVCAAEAPAEWTKWVEKNQKELKEEFAEQTAKDLIHLESAKPQWIVPDGKNSFEFALSKAPGSVGILKWNGDKKLELETKKPLKIKFAKGDEPNWLKIPLTSIGPGLALNGFKRTEDKYLIVFLYDSKRPGLEAIREFNVFEYAPDFKVKAEFIPLAKPVPMTIPATRGEPKKWQKFGDFKFSILGKPQTLQVIGASGKSKMTMLMFHDASNGATTYKGGRYLDVKLNKPIEAMKAGDSVELDFNFSNSPVCARSAAFMCPVPLDQMQIAVLAGEKKVR